MLETKKNSFRHIGRPQRRADAPERLTGRTRFTQDLAPADALHVHFVRSPYAAARIVSVDKQAALAIPGVVAVLTVHDLPLVDAESAVLAREIVMAFDRVVHVGQPVVAVLAESEAAAQDGVQAVEVEYEPSPVVIDPVAAQTSDVAVAKKREPSAEELAMHGSATQTVADQAIAVGRPVRAVYSRQEEFSSADPAPESRIRVKIGAKRDGTLVAL